ncbi:MAG: 4a-hydroxytetrahydrobiopterin dehydratase [Acidiferrobacter sp.]
MDEPQLNRGWQVQQKPPLLTRRFDFGAYAETRKFLDDLASLSERTGYYPDLGFGKTHVSVSITAQYETLGEAEFDFAAKADALLGLASIVKSD